MSMKRKGVTVRRGFGRLATMIVELSTNGGFRTAGLAPLSHAAVVILVGGKGTRLRPLTLSAPKPMLPTAGLPFLATIGSSAPFIGLFGTVIGIMKSFGEIGTKGSANLATVAPGISEACCLSSATMSRERSSRTRIGGAALGFGPPRPGLFFTRLSLAAAPRFSPVGQRMRLAFWRRGRSRLRYKSFPAILQGDARPVL